MATLRTSSPRPAPRVALRQLTAGDQEEFLAAAHASRRLHDRWVAPPLNEAEFRSWVEVGAREDVDINLACRTDGGAIAGVFTLSQIYYRAFCNAYLGYYALAPHAGQGLMTEGMALLLRRAFSTLRLHRVEANIQPGNERSIALAQRSGFRREGYSPRYLKINGRWRDHERWAMTVEDWRALASSGGVSRPQAAAARPSPGATRRGRR